MSEGENKVVNYNPNTLNKSQLISKVLGRTIYSANEMEQIVDHIFDIIAEELYNLKEVNIVNFGRFTLYKHKARPVRNPQTMEPMTLAEYYSVKFRPSRYIRKRLKYKDDSSKG